MSRFDWVILGIFTLANLWFSWWVSLRQRRYHGISRFFSFQSLILGGFGAMMKDAGWVQISLAGVNLLAVYITAKVEEKEMILKFGQSYTAYMKETKLFIPFLL